MSDFWNDIDEDALETGKTEVKDDGGVLPDGAKVPCTVERAGYYDGDNVTANIMWRVTDGDFANRVVFHKMLIDGDDAYNPEKSDAKRKRGRQQFATMLKLAGATDLLEGLKAGEIPSEMDLQADVIGGEALLTVGLWEIGGKKGNWVKAIEPVGGVAPAAKPFVSKPAKKAPVDLDDEIPF